MALDMKLNLSIPIRLAFSIPVLSTPFFSLFSFVIALTFFLLSDLGRLWRTVAICARIWA